MTPGHLVRVTVTCDLCGHRTPLAPASYLEGEVFLVLCPGCEIPLTVIIAIPVERIAAPEWYTRLFDV
jgi:hypothetical protein